MPKRREFLKSLGGVAAGTIAVSARTLGRMRVLSLSANVPPGGDEGHDPSLETEMAEAFEHVDLGTSRRRRAIDDEPSRNGARRAATRRRSTHRDARPGDRAGVGQQVGETCARCDRWLALGSAPEEPVERGASSWGCRRRP